MKIADFSVKNSVLVNFMMIALFVGGTMSLLQMPTELNPPIPFNWVFITIPYPGASPTETEALIVDPIESEIQDVDKIDEIQSNAGEGFAFVMVKFEDISDSEFRELYVDLKAEVDKVEFPEDAEEPVFEKFSSEDFLPVIQINMSYTLPEANAQVIADDMQKDIQDLPGVSKIQVSGLADREIWVEVDPVKMNTLGLTFDDITFAIKARNLNVPGGNITFGKTEYLIRSLGEYQSVDEIRETVVRTGAGGKFIKVKDVATVTDRREELDIYSRMNGHNSITISVSKKSESNSIDVIDNIKAIVAEYENKVPDGVTFKLTNDNAIYIKRVINILRNNALTGMILIIIVLYAFLGKANAALASLGIPISFFITFIFLNIYGYSLNGNTLFALVMVLGIIVDDAIIVIENCHRYRLAGYNSFQSAVLGTSEVVKPIFASIATNIAAFLPLILLPGIMGKFMRIIPITFSLALIASLFEAFILLPSHYADWTVKSKVYHRGEKKFFKVLRKRYTKTLFFVLRKRYFTFAFAIFILICSLALIPFLGVEMFGEEDFDQFKVLVKFPEGTSLEENNRIMKKFEQEAFNLPQEDIEAIITNVGLLQGNDEWLVQKNVAQIFMQLKPVEQRTHATRELLNMMREATQDISGPVSAEYELLAGGPPTGKPISVKVQGQYLDEIKQASLALQDSLKLIKGAYDISDNFPPGKQEIRIEVDEEKAAFFGFSTQFVAMNVRYAFDGIEATEYRDGDEEIDVVVKYNDQNRSSVDDVLNLRLTNTQGQTVALREMVDFVIKPGRTQINRFDQERTIMVTGEIDKSKVTLDVVNNKMVQIFPKIEKVFPGVNFEIGGEFEEFQDVFANIGQLFLISMLIIFLILGTQFNSYIQPLIILTTVPFALIGATIGLIISGNPFSIIAMFGFVALAGIVVNDAIVMIDFMNRRRAGDNPSVYTIWRAIINGGRLRLRPIILTSLTTISGLVPMAFGIGGMSEMWAPLANVILFGLLGSTVLTLFFVPSLMAIVDDIRGLRKKAILKNGI